MSDLKWIKLAVDIFDDEKILLIEAQPDADATLLVWIKLLVLAGRTNNGGVFLLAKGQPYTAEMLATIFRRPVEVIKSALDCFESFGMVEYVDGVITIPNWEKHQSIDELTRIKEQNRERQKRYREKQKALAGDNVTHNDKITLCHGTEENRREENIYIVEIVAHLNHVCGTHYKTSTKNTRRLIAARIREGFLQDDFFKVIDTKAAEWLDDPKMKKYLRPQTLFGSKFESYLNEVAVSAASPQRDVISHEEIEARKRAERALL